MMDKITLLPQFLSLDWSSSLVRHIHSITIACFHSVSIIAFSGNLAHTRPRQVMMEYPTFVSSLAAMAESEDPVAQAIALETVGYIGVSLEGKVLAHFDEMGLNIFQLALAEPKKPKHVIDHFDIELI